LEVVWFVFFLGSSRHPIPWVHRKIKPGYGEKSMSETCFSLRSPFFLSPNLVINQKRKTAGALALYPCWPGFFSCRLSG
jgi:hypothetical protein